MERLPVLHTQRLVISVPTGADADRLAAYHSANRSHLAPWEPARADEYFTAAYWRRMLPSLAEEVRQDRSVTFILSSAADPTGPVQGRCALTNIARGPFQAAHLGFSLAASAVGKGLMHEALSAVIAFAFGELSLHRIMANYMPGNARSAALLARLRFLEEGLAREYLLIDGAWRDHVLTSLVNPRWQRA